MALLLAAGGCEPVPTTTGKNAGAGRSEKGTQPYAAAAPARASATPGANSVAADSLVGADARTHALSDDVAFLASDELEGRAPGSPGSEAARGFIVEHLTAAGLLPAFDGDFAQPFQRANGRSGVNVAARLVGREAPPRYLVVSAHYDHLGVARGKVYNGADDNASGVAVLLELTTLLEPNQLEHSLLFVAFDSEEHGLSGSRAFVDGPPVPLDAIDGDLNLDMVGRSDGRGIWVAGTRYTPALAPLVETAARGLALPVLLGHDGGDGRDDWTLSSDHGPFHQRGIPFLYLGVEDHPDYHRPTDDWEKIDFGSVRDVLELTRRLVVALDGALPEPSTQPAASP